MSDEKTFEIQLMEAQDWEKKIIEEKKHVLNGDSILIVNNAYYEQNRHWVEHMAKNGKTVYMFLNGTEIAKLHTSPFSWRFYEP